MGSGEAKPSSFSMFPLRCAQSPISEWLTERNPFATSSKFAASPNKKHMQLVNGSLADKPITASPGVGPVFGDNFNRNGIHSVCR